MGTTAFYVRSAIVSMTHMCSTQVDESAPMPPIAAELNLNKKACAGLEACKQLISGIRQVAARGTPADALSYAIAQVRSLHEPMHAPHSCDPGRGPPTCDPLLRSTVRSTFCLHWRLGWYHRRPPGLTMVCIDRSATASIY